MVFARSPSRCALYFHFTVLANLSYLECEKEKKKAKQIIENKLSVLGEGEIELEALNHSQQKYTWLNL